jgi:hypothetical protein
VSLLKKGNGMEFTVFAGKNHGQWMVEAIDMDSEGEMLWAEFSGFNAQERANEYASWMTSKLAARQLRHRRKRNAQSAARNHRAKVHQSLRRK